MSDSIDRAGRILPTRYAERVTAATPIHAPRREREEDGFTFEDQIDIAPAAHLQNAPEEIDLSLAMIRALIAQELPPEAIEALMQFAPLGDFSDADENMERVEQKGSDFIVWPNTKSLTQALSDAAT